MITIESIFSKKNIKAAFAHLSVKRNGGGTDRSPLSELHSYWELNKERIIEEVKAGSYYPDLVMQYEIINRRGKRRVVTKFADIDRFITRLLAQKLKAFYAPCFLGGSHAYQDNKGIITAVEQAKGYIEKGNEYVTEVDIHNFFDEISLERLISILRKDIKDERIMMLLVHYFYCDISFDGNVSKKNKGLVQGCSISPVLSNLYLCQLDQFMEEREYHWIRFGDDIHIYTPSMREGNEVFSEVVRKLQTEFLLPVNDKKSGVFDVYERRFLGYDFYVKIERHNYQKSSYYRNWHENTVSKVNKEYHILQNGIMNKKDYAILFENEEQKHHIPVEATEQLNLYSEVTLTSSVLRTLSYEKIRLGIYDRYGNLQGYYIPEGYVKDAKVLLEQSRIYLDAKERLVMARKMEIASIHNIRANLRYYNKRNGGKLEEEIDILTEGIRQMNQCKDLTGLLLEEARCRQVYYHSFNVILKNKDFLFEKRTKRPPKDRINALISFGNTLLYNYLQQIIWKTSLDSRIGIVHAANRRNYSLNLDFADLFKPLIVDRIIFALINRKQLSAMSFTEDGEGAVYLSENGKRIFISTFYEKLQDKLTVGNQRKTYSNLMETEIYTYQNSLLGTVRYKPYKYF